jgi:type II secretory pathway pseudopilin PulG
MFLNKNLKRNKGISLVEMIVYVAILSAVFVLVINTLLIVSRSYKAIKLSNDVNNSASISLERLTREIKLSNSVNTTSSILDSNPGRLVLNTVDEFNAPLVLDFYIVDGTLALDKNSVLFGVLTRDNIEVTNLIFRYITSSTSEAVKIEMELTGTEGNKTKIENFYTSAVLRGSY